MQEKLKICGIPAVLYGEACDGVWLFIHGKSGCKEEGEAFAAVVCPKGWQVLAIDLPEHGQRGAEQGFDPWRVVPELQSVMEYLRLRWKHVALRANSIGAWFSMQALADTPPERALFVSPILDMEKLICNMMSWASVTEQMLEKQGEIATPFGETLSWRYLQYAKTHRIEKWDSPTAILYAGQDGMTDRKTVGEFASRFACGLTVMENGEHWFHTPEQLEALGAWEDENTKNLELGR